MQIWLEALAGMGQAVARLLLAPTQMRGLLISTAVRNITPRILDDYRATTRTWNHQVDFVTEIDQLPNEVVVRIGTRDAVYNYVNWGAPRHVIVPVRAKALRFQTAGIGSYQAKTAPGVIGSRQGGPVGPFVFRKKVDHPGIVAPRRFDEAITNKWARTAQGFFQNAVRTFWANWSYTAPSGLSSALSQAQSAATRTLSRFRGP